MTGEVHLFLVSEGLAVMTDAVAGAARDRGGGQSGGAGARMKTMREMKGVVWRAVVDEEDQGPYRRQQRKVGKPDRQWKAGSSGVVLVLGDTMACRWQEVAGVVLHVVH